MKRGNKLITVVIILVMLGLFGMMGHKPLTTPKDLADDTNTTEATGKSNLKENVDDTLQKAKEIAKKDLDIIKGYNQEFKDKYGSDIKGLADEGISSLKSLKEKYGPEVVEGFHKVIGKAHFDKAIKDGFNYGNLDSLGRPTWASMKITPQAYNKEKQEKREDIKVNPTAWPKRNPKVSMKYNNGDTYKGYFWNRSHMVADSLGGEPIKENLITGTRSQNVGGRNNAGGMAYLETKIRNYFDEGNTGTVDYLVENVYNGNELIPQYTIVNAKSDDGKIDEEVIVPNKADGYEINYTTAEIKEVA